MSSNRRARDRFPFIAILTLLVIASALLVRFTWLKVGDPVVDTGRELSVPWRILRGETLYRDIAYNYGPFSPYLNAIFLKVLGVRFTSIVVSGLVSATVGGVLFFFTARLYLGRSLSCGLVGVYLLESVFQHYFPNNAFNFILPYTFAAPHATIFAFASFICLVRWIDTTNPRWLAFSGGLAGMSALCKLEIAGAASGTLLLMPVLLGIHGRRGLRAVLADEARWLLPFMAVTLAGFLPFVLCASPHAVFARNLLPSALVNVQGNVFFGRLLGLDDPIGNLRAALRSSAIWAMLIAIAAAGTWFLRAGRIEQGREQLARPYRVLGAATLGLVAIGLALTLLSLDDKFQCFNLLCMAVLIATGARILRSRGETGSPDARLFALAAFALLFLARIFLKISPLQYGFYMALPGVILLTVVGAVVIPGWLHLSDAPKSYLGFVVLAALLSLSARDFRLHSAKWFQMHTLELAGRNGRMLSLPSTRYESIAKALDYIHEHEGEIDKLAVFPCGVVNFLSDFPNPLYDDWLLPPVLNARGVEQEVISQLETRHVDHVLIIDWKPTEYGFNKLGEDYGVKLFRYIEDHFKMKAIFGPEDYGCVLYVRNSDARGSRE